MSSGTLGKTRSTFKHQLNCLYTNNEYEETEIKNIIPFTIPHQSVQSLSRVWLFVTPWIAAHQASLSIANSRCLLKLTSIESMMPSNHLILYLPLLLLPSVLSSIRVFSKESDWKRLCISFSISPSNEYSGWISFRFDWFDLLTIQRTLKSL